MYETFIESVPLLKSLEVSRCFLTQFLLCSCPQSIKLVVKLVPQLTLATEKEIYLIAKEMAQV